MELLVITKIAISTQLLKASPGKLSMPLSPCSAVYNIIKNLENSFWIVPCRETM